MITGIIRDIWHSLIVIEQFFLIGDLRSYVSFAVKVYGNSVKYSEKIQNND